MGIATDMTAAREAGAQAARAGASRGTCPHSPDPNAEPRERTLFGLWMSGYRSVRPLPIDYSDEEA
ncbi:ribosome modulation factor [Nocardiopsis tropica]|uniref:Uncharacterized protein n=1 Tax=Nocardiopsis tropica TaxID=109330 RepID=A0ABU7KMG0_9ACTN|nr:hypothetical protein [Nocardiopsis umidischolae]MEE2050317.1 hypothetical protein [Nocardiopsis umidischolae]